MGLIRRLPAEWRNEKSHYSTLRSLEKNNDYSLTEFAFEVNDVYSYYAYKCYPGNNTFEVSPVGIQYLYCDPVSLEGRGSKLFSFAIAQLLRLREVR